LRTGPGQGSMPLADDARARTSDVEDDSGEEAISLAYHSEAITIHLGSVGLEIGIVSADAS
jgi:hypothetical protein